VVDVNKSRPVADISPASGRQSVPLVMAVALLLAGTRWASYIHIPSTPIYATDVLIVLGGGKFLLRRRAPDEASLLPAAAVLLLGWTCIRFLSSPTMEMVAFRDAWPYLCAALTLASASAFRSGRYNEEATYRVLLWALRLHLFWCLGTLLLGMTAFPQIPSSPVRLFELRPDIDSALMGLLAALSLRDMVTGKQRVISTWSAVLGIGGSLALHSRAGLLSTFLVVAVSALWALRRMRRDAVLHAVVLSLLPILLAGGAFLVVKTPSGERLFATFGGDTPSTQSQISAEGTTRARSLVWQRSLEYAQESPTRLLFGVGFGPNFLMQSGAAPLLEGTTYSGVRSPHNHFVGTLARLGIVGVTLLALFLLALLRAAKTIWAMQSSRLPFSCLLLCLAMLPVATLGVVLESPFGAVPFFWASGIVLAAGRWGCTVEKAVERGTAPSRPVQVPERTAS
jgi:hypothetical protein